MQGSCAHSTLRQLAPKPASVRGLHISTLLLQRSQAALAHHKRLALASAGVRSAAPASEPLPAAFLDHLVQQASQQLVVAVPEQSQHSAARRSSPPPPGQPSVQQQGPIAKHPDRSTASQRTRTALALSSVIGATAPTLQPWHAPQHARPATHAAQPKPKPRRLEFEAMYTALQAWQRQYLTCHVPHHCFDAPELGAWVRHMRKEHKEGRLEQWKVDRLNALGMEWHVADADAKWHHCYHQLRRFKLVHGHTNIPAGYRDANDRDWEMVSRWLERQARLLAKEHLPEQRRRMLAALGVTLLVPEELLTRYSRLRGMNGHERKLERRRWKAKRMAADEARHEAQVRLRAKEAAMSDRLQQEQELRGRILHQQEELTPVQPQPQQVSQHAAPAGVPLGSAVRLFGLNSQAHRKGKGRTREERWLAQEQ